MIGNMVPSVHTDRHSCCLPLPVVLESYNSVSGHGGPRGATGGHGGPREATGGHGRPRGATGGHEGPRGATGGEIRSRLVEI